MVWFRNKKNNFECALLTSDLVNARNFYHFLSFLKVWSIGLISLPLVLMNRLNKSESAVFSLFLKDSFSRLFGIHKMLVRITNREDPDQTASSEAV